MRSKKYRLIKEGLRKLKAKEKKKSTEVEIAYTAEVESFNTSSPYLSPLVDPFTFNLSFLILPNIFSNNIPVPFL